jgi:hypothetical protein
MTILWSNNASTTVSGSITTASTSVMLAAGTGVLFPNPTGGDFYVATFYDQATKTQNEIVHVTAMVGDVATIVRAQEGTVAIAWNAGDIFANLVTAGTLRAFVQGGVAGPAITTDVYVGTDTGTVDHIVAVTNPVPQNVIVGMQFNILVKNANDGPTTLQLNGGTAILVKRTDGSDVIGGNFIANQEYIFVYNGQFFNTTIMHVPQTPPQTTFYVRPDSTSVVDSNGMESNSGFANIPAQAFLTLQGAVNTLKSRYISQSGLTIRVADGTYNSGVYDNEQYISSWNFIGNTASPGNVRIVATSTSQATYVPGAVGGICVFVGQFATISMNGFTFQSYDRNVASGGSCNLTNCNFTAPQNGLWAMDATGLIQIQGACTFSGANACASIFCARGGVMSVGFYSAYFGSSGFSMAIQGTPVVTQGCASSTSSGTFICYDNVMSFSGQCSGADFVCNNAGGFIFNSGNTGIFPGSTAGVVAIGSPGASLGGWVTAL